MSTISQLYSQFRACGQIGQDPVSHMNNAIERVQNMPNFDQKLATVSATYEHEEKNKALFVQAVLKNHNEGLDPSFSSLQTLNRTLNLFESATNTVRSQTTKQIEALKNCYFSQGRIEGYAGIMQNLGCSVWQTHLPTDVAAKIMGLLSLRDHFRASATCSAWHKAACRPHGFSPTYLPHEIPFISSFTTSLTRSQFLAQRRLVEAASINEPSDRLLLRHGNQEVLALYNRNPGDPIIFHTEHAIGVVNGNKRFTISHDFHSEYKLLSVPSLHKIFVINQDETHIHSIHEIDTTTGSMTTLASEATETTALRIDYRDNKIWMVDAENRLHTFDLAAGKLCIGTEPILLTTGGRGLNNYKNMLRIFTSAGPTATFATEDLTNLAEGAHPIPNTEHTTRFTTITDRVLYASYTSEKKVTAFDRISGEVLKDYPHSILPSSWFTPAALISEGFLYLTVGYHKTEVYDLLTGKLIRTITFDEDDDGALGSQVLANKLIYIYKDTELRIKTLGAP